MFSLKKILCLISIIALTLIPLNGTFAEPTVSASYKVSVTIPALIGINVPASQEFSSALADKSNPKDIQEVKTEKVSRHGETFLLTTVIPK